MEVPRFHEFIQPLLKVLAAHPDGMRAREAIAAVADAVALTPEQRAQLLPSGVQAVYENRIHWTHHRTKYSGLSEAPRKGFWKITEAGLRDLRAHPNGFPKEFIDRLAKAPSRNNSELANEVAEPDVEAVGQGPEERIDRALRELSQTVAAEILQLVLAGSAEDFERLVLDVLHQAGYGARREDLQRVGGRGDGGIDGVIPLDKLGLQKVYVQAKRWQGNVSSAVVREFFGALASHKAQYGVLVTTSAFTRDALDTASKLSDTLVLIDGDRLAQLMIDNEVGITKKNVPLPRIDRDYFEEA